MSASSRVEVGNLAPTTTKQALEDFFSFCGTIEHVDLTPGSSRAAVTFANSSSASNAAMLNGGTLNDAAIAVSLPSGSAADAGAGAGAAAASADSSGLARQEDKPKSTIIAEYLASGYKLSDDITKRALDLDQKNGYSTKFSALLSSVDRKLGERTAGMAAAAPAAPPAADAGTGEESTRALGEKEAPVGTQPPAGSASSTSSAPPGQPSFVGNVQEKFNQQLQDPTSYVGQAHSRVSNLMARPQVSSWWSTLGSYYTMAANHPQVQKVYTDTTRSVEDVRQESQRIAREKYGMEQPHHFRQLFQSPATSASAPEAGAAAPSSTSNSNQEAMPTPPAQPEAPGKASMNWLFVFVLFMCALAVGANAHGDEDDAAAIAGVTPPNPGDESYIQKHMANEHHINAFDMGSFFTLHDLNRDGVWDRAEVEAIYGVHHSMSIKHSPTAEVHDEKADKIVREVFKRLDLNGDSMITPSEFSQSGAHALPFFPEYGVGVLGHHYDAESEFFVHHEEKYHSTPETQTDQAYSHPEDVEHFMSHQKIEDEEENRERKAEGMPSIEEDLKLREEAEAKGQAYESQFEKNLQNKRPEDQEFHEVEQDAYYGGNAQDEAATVQHVFRGPNGPHLVKSHEQKNASHSMNAFERRPGETDQGFEQRKQLFEQRLQAAEYFNKLEKEQKARVAKASEKIKQEKGESEAAFLRRLNKAKWEAEQRDGYGKGAKGFARPKDDADRLRKGTPYKNRLKKGSYFGEF